VTPKFRLFQLWQPTSELSILLTTILTNKHTGFMSFMKKKDIYSFRETGGLKIREKNYEY